MVVTFQSAHGFEQGQAYCALPTQSSYDLLLQVMHQQCHALEGLKLLERSRKSP
jgi:hypothetical protein